MASGVGRRRSPTATCARPGRRAAPGRATRRRGRRSRAAATTRPAATCGSKGRPGANGSARRSSTRRATGCRRCHRAILAGRHVADPALECCRGDGLWFRPAARRDISPLHADVAQLVAHHLAKVRVAGSSPVVRSEDPPCWPRSGSVEWPRGEATACKAVYTGSNPVSTSVTTEGHRPHGRLAQGLARFLDTEEVTGSIPVSPTIDDGPRSGGGLVVLGPSGPTRLTGRRRWERGSTYGNVGGGLSPSDRQEQHVTSAPFRASSRAAWACRLVLAARAHRRPHRRAGRRVRHRARHRAGPPPAGRRPRRRPAPRPRRVPRAGGGRRGARALLHRGRPARGDALPRHPAARRSRRALRAQRLHRGRQLRRGLARQGGPRRRRRRELPREDPDDDAVPRPTARCSPASTSCSWAPASRPTSRSCSNGLAEHRTSRRCRSTSSTRCREETWAVTIDPVEVLGVELPPLRRPTFLAIVANHVLAQLPRPRRGDAARRVRHRGTHAQAATTHRRAASSCSTRPGQPVYGPRDEADTDQVRRPRPAVLARRAPSARPSKLREAESLGARGIQVGTLFAMSRDSGLPSRPAATLRNALRDGTLQTRTDALASPTGFPFKVAHRRRHALGPVAARGPRPPVCDLGHLRTAFRREDGELDYRCPSEPVRDVRAQGRRRRATSAAASACATRWSRASACRRSARTASELPLVTLGDDLDGARVLLAARPLGYDGRRRHRLAARREHRRLTLRDGALRRPERPSDHRGQATRARLRPRPTPPRRRPVPGVRAACASRAAPVWDDGLGMWLAFRYDDANAVLRDRHLGRIFTAREPEDVWETFNWLHEDALLENEPPKHTRLRRWWPRRSRAARSRAAAAASRSCAASCSTSCATKLAETGTLRRRSPTTPSRCPVLVIADLLGVPESDDRRRCARGRRPS